MKKDIRLKITGTVNMHERGSEPRKDVIEYITEGTLYQHGKITRIAYDELEDSGLYGGRTHMTVTPNMVRVMRKDGDDVTLKLDFREGRRYTGEYSTPYGPIGMELLTNKIEGFGGEAVPGSKLCIDYSMSLKGISESDNKLEFEILNGEEND